MKIAILGFSREGKAVLSFLRKSPIYKNSEVIILDRNPKVVSGIEYPVSNIQTGKNYLKNLDRFNLVFRSPAVPYNLPALIKARGKGVEFSSLMNLFFSNCPAKIVGITGTKGKGTTATLLYKILRAAHKDAYLAGNIGIPALDILPKLKGSSIVVLELSSFQLQDLKTSPQIAAVLDTFPDHLENIKTAKHGTHLSLREYYLSKANIAKWQKSGDKVFYFPDNKNSVLIVKKSRGKKIPVSAKNFKLFKPEDLKMKGHHNFKNAMMAATIAQALDIPESAIIKTIKSFPGNEHRLEFVRSIHIPNSRYFHKLVGSHYVDFYNDSASTNPQTTAAAVDSFGPNILIAGGKDKNLNYVPLTKALKKSQTKLVILFGENKNKILKAIKDSGVPIKVENNLKSAVRAAYNFAHTKYKILNTRYTVIFSPGSSSFDMFKDYADRGQKFKELIRKLK